MATPHDALFKAVFSSPQDAVGLVRPLLPVAVADVIDWSELALVPGSFVDEALRSRHADLLFAVPIATSPGLLYFLTEHKSRPERFTVLHLLGCMVRIWAQWRRDHPRSRFLPRIVPVVLHHGPRPWSAPLRLRDLFDCRAVDARVGAMLDTLGPDLTLLLDDLALMDETELRRRPVSPLARLALAFLGALRNAGEAGTLRLVRRWLDVIGATLATADGAERIVVLWSYILDVTDVAAGRLGEVVDAVGPQATATLMSTANRLRAEGRAEILLRQLTRRFGPLPQRVADRVRAGSSADLDRWADAVLTAPSLETVFDED